MANDFRRSRVGARTLEADTLMLGFGFDPTLSEGAVKTPIFLTSTFAYSTCEEGKLLFDYMSGRQISPEGADAGLIYTRFNNPNLQIVEERLAILEGADACSVFSSGMAAIFTSILALTEPGEVIVTSRPLYGGTETLFDNLLARWGVRRTSFIDGVDPAQVRAAADRGDGAGQGGCDLCRDPRQPDQRRGRPRPDGRRRRRDRRAAGLAPAGHRRQHPARDRLYQAPLKHGADLSVYSLTKYVGGHSDLIAGSVAGSRAADAQDPRPAQFDRQPARRA